MIVLLIFERKAEINPILCSCNSWETKYSNEGNQDLCSSWLNWIHLLQQEQRGLWQIIIEHKRGETGEQGGESFTQKWSVEIVESENYLKIVAIDKIAVVTHGLLLLCGCHVIKK